MDERKATKIDELRPELKRFVEMIKHYQATGEGFDKIRDFVLQYAIVALVNEVGVEYRFLPSDLDDWKGKLKFTYTDRVLTDIEFIPDETPNG